MAEDAKMGNPIVKPRIGAGLMVSGWFIDTVGIDGSTNEEYAALGEQLDRDVETIVRALEAHFDVVFPGLVTSVGEAQAAVDAFRGEDVDAVVIVHVMWSDDDPLIRLISGAGSRPAMLWHYNPFRKLPESMTMNDLFRSSGSVGILQGSAPMKKMGFGFEFCFGAPEDEGVHKKLEDFARALSVKKGMRGCRIGQIGPRCEGMTGTYTDEARLLETFGAEVVQIPVSRLAEEAGAVPQGTVDRFVDGLKERHAVDGVDDVSLLAAARATLGVEKLVLDEDLAIVSIQDLDEEMHELLKTRPCLWTETLSERGTAVSMERDTVSGAGVYICSALLGSPCMYGEIFTCDLGGNAIVFGHAGMHDPRVAGDGARIIKDMEYYQSDATAGAWQKFCAKPGDVTLVSLFCGEGGYRAVSFKGYAVPGVDKMPYGFPHAYIRCEKPLDYLYESLVRSGLTQHFSLCWGDIDERLRMFCGLANIEYVEL